MTPFDGLTYLTPTPEAAEPVEAWRDVLERAADYIEAHGHCQKIGGIGPLGERCSVQAMVETSGVGPIVSDACKRLERMIGCGVIGWNDAPGRTPAEVISALRQCARS